MRSPFRTACLAAVVAAALPVAAAFAQEAPAEEDDGHGHGRRQSDLVLADLPPDQRARAQDAWNHVICNCPRENWSKTLLNCPDGCAIPQRQQVLRRIVEGWSLDRIVEEQVKLHGDKAAADPGTSANGTLLVLAGVVFGGGVAAMVFAARRKKSEDRRTAAADDRSHRPTSTHETDAVERELQEID